jgi:hypothetical protein
MLRLAIERDLDRLVFAMWNSCEIEASPPACHSKWTRLEPLSIQKNFSLQVSKMAKLIFCTGRRKFCFGLERALFFRKRIGGLLKSYFRKAA